MKTEGRDQHEDDGLLASLGEHVRRDQEDDRRFERVAAGEAGASEIAELETAAAADPALAIRFEASRPLPSDALDRIALRAANALAKSEPRKSSAPVPEKAATVTPISRWRLRAVSIAGPLALAAGIVLYVAGGSKSGDDLPSYGVFASSQAAMRGPSDPGTSLHLSPGKDGRFELVLRPATAPTTKIVAYAFALGAGSEPMPLDAKVEVAPEGSVRVSGASKMLEGAREIRVVLGAPDAIGKFDDAVTRAKAASGDGHVRVITVPIER